MRSLLDQLSTEGRLAALTHSSYAGEAGLSYERLEFLGDSVLGLVMSAELFRRFPDAPEGELSKLKASAVSRAACAIVAREHGLPEAMLAAAPADADPKGLEALATSENVISALTESVIGAAFVELGYEVVAPVIVATFADRIGHAVDNRTDSKSELQELAQRNGTTVEYRVVAEDGPDHDRVFTVQACYGEDGSVAVGEGRSKKAAEQLAAQNLLKELGAN